MTSLIPVFTFIPTAVASVLLMVFLKRAHEQQTQARPATMIATTRN